MILGVYFFPLLILIARPYFLPLLILFARPVFFRSLFFPLLIFWGGARRMSTTSYTRLTYLKCIPILWIIRVLRPTHHPIRCYTLQCALRQLHGPRGLNVLLVLLCLDTVFLYFRYYYYYAVLKTTWCSSRP